MEHDIVSQKEKIVAQETESYSLRRELGQIRKVLDEKQTQIQNWKNMYNNLLSLVEQQRGSQTQAM